MLRPVLRAVLFAAVGSPLGDFLVKARKERGLTLREVQRRTGIHNAHLSQVERGIIERPHLSLLLELAAAYHVDFRELAELAGHVGSQAQEPRAVRAAALRAIGQLDTERQNETLDFVARLQAWPRPAKPGLELGARQRIRAMADRVLQEANLGEGPTSLTKIGHVVGVQRVAGADAIPAPLRKEKPAAWKRILGAVSFEGRVIYIDRHQTSGRTRFTHAHELAHLLLPWHEAAFRLDDERSLFYSTRNELEAEANLAAAHLLFRGDRYFKKALVGRQSVATPIRLARDFDASITASIRYYVENHPRRVAAIIAGRFPQYDGTLPIWGSIESDGFLASHGQLVDHVPRGALALQDDPHSEFARLATEALGKQGTTPMARLRLADLDGRPRQFSAEAFFNGFSLLVVVHGPQRGRRS